MKTFQTAEPITVVVELGMGSVHLTASDRTDATVDVRPSDPAKSSDVSAAAQTKVEFADGTLVVKGPRGWRHWSPRSHESIAVIVEVPTGSDVKCSAGSADIIGVGCFGDFQGRAGVTHARIDDVRSLSVAGGAGDIDLSRAAGHVEVKMSGAVRIGTVGGGAVIKNSNGSTTIHDIAGDLRLTAANGDVVVNRARSTVVVKTANGDVRIGETALGAVSVDTARGKVDIGIANGVAAWLDLSTALGSVHNELEAAGPPAAGADSINVRARTAFGDITIRRAYADTPA